jgi:hypothetical protein
MKTKIYLIGSIHNDVIDFDTQYNFSKEQIRFEEKGYEVFNPLKRLMNKDISTEVAKKQNLEDLMEAHIAYIMPCVNIVKKTRNFEIQMALKLNKTFVLGAVDISECQPNEKSILIK